MSAVAEARCAYCAEFVCAPEQEHIFPESWYPDGTGSQHMLTVPSDSDCNRNLGAIEERLVRSLIMGLHPNNLMAMGVRARVLNGMNSLRAKGKTVAAREKDARARAGSWRKFKDRTHVVPAEQPVNAFPTTQRLKPYLIRTEAGLWVKGMGAVSFDPADLHAITAKFVRGIYYLKMGSPLPPTVPIRTAPIAWEAAHQVITRMRWPRRGIHMSFVYWGDVVTKDPLSSIWFFKLWDEYVLSAMTGQFARENREQEPLLQTASVRQPLSDSK